MSIIVPSHNVLSLWFTENGRHFDVVDSFRLFEKHGILGKGMEMYLVLAELESSEKFPPWFYRGISKLKYKTLHLGGRGVDFLTEIKEVEEKLDLLSQILERLEIDSIILHAQHLKRNRLYLRKLFDDYLPNTNILIENDGLGFEWASSIEGLLEIFNDCPDYGLCLDICHIKDVNKSSLWDFVEEEEIRSRIKQIHFSFSSRMLGYDPYARYGFPGYAPNHALFSLVKESISKKTRDFILQFPIVIEGLVPREDKNLDYLRKEIELLS